MTTLKYKKKNTPHCCTYSRYSPDADIFNYIPQLLATKISFPVHLVTQPPPTWPSSCTFCKKKFSQNNVFVEHIVDGYVVCILYSTNSSAASKRSAGFVKPSKCLQ